MNLHPQLWLPFAGAILGAPLIAFLTLRLLMAWLRRSNPKRWTLFCALGLFEVLYWLCIYAWFIEPNRLVVRPLTVFSEHWSGPPLRIAVIGDVHVGSPYMNVRRLQRIVERINSERPDLVVLLGDYVGDNSPSRPPHSAQQQLDAIALFAALNARYGAVAVLGNHDVWWDRTQVTGALERAGVAVLWNRSVTIARSSGRFIVAGLADSRTGSPDLQEAFGGAGRHDAIVLTHSPDAFPDFLPYTSRNTTSARARGRRIALTLAAHTHCGQVSLPFVGRLIVPSEYGQKYACGLIEEQGQKLYVTAGLGASVAPMRFLNPPEIALITLRSYGNAMRVSNYPVEQPHY